MAARDSQDPTHEELVAFARTLLGELGADLTDADLLEETVRDARELWLLLYRAHRGEEPHTA